MTEASAYQTGTEQTVNLVLDTIRSAVKKEKAAAGLQLHSDQGFQYTSQEYFHLTKEYGITPSMSRQGNCYDNAMAENFFSILKVECIYRKKPKTLEEARQRIATYISFYNYERIQLKTGMAPFALRNFSTYVIVQGSAAASYTPGVSYAAHVQNIGWQKFAADGTETGTEHRALRMEAVQVKLTGTLPAGASIVYQGHVQNKGWLTSVSDGAVGGTTGKGLRLEALRITLKGLTGYAVKYRAYVQNKGWLDWVTTANGTDLSKASIAGTTDKGLRMEALEIQIVALS